MVTTRTDNSAPTNPVQLLALGTRFAEAQVVLSALKLGVFPLLGDGALAEEELREKLGLHPRPAHAFFGVLVELGLLRETEDGLATTAAVRRYLVPGEPGYVGGFLSRADEVLYGAWGKLPEALVSGEPQVGKRKGNPFDEVTEVPEQVLRFLDMMDAMNALVSPALAKALDWSEVRTVADIGGARGNVLASLVSEFPGLTGTVFDLPAMGKPFADHMQRRGVSDRVSFVGGDFFADDLPSADVLVIGHVLHDWGDEECRTLVRKAYDALPSGGRLAIYDVMLDDELRQFKLIVSLHMLFTTEHGREYEASECEAWCAEAGFAEIETRRLGYLDTLVIAVKP